MCVCVCTGTYPCAPVSTSVYTAYVCAYVHAHPCVMEEMSAYTSYDSVSVLVDSACLSVSVGPGGCV